MNVPGSYGGPIVLRVVRDAWEADTAVEHDRPARVLLVEDETRLARMVQRGLQHAGFDVEVVHDGLAALAACEEDGPDLLVLDIGIPRADGLAVLRHLRGEGDERPVLLLTGRSGVSDRVTGLRAGADDYLPKPFALDELTARIEVLLRRHGRGRSATVASGSVELDPAARTVVRRGEPVELTEREFDLLAFFLRNPRQVLSRDLILERVWHTPEATESNVVAVYVKYLRDKVDRPFGTSSLTTVRGRGYRWDPDEG